MNDSHLVSISQLKEFLKGGMEVTFDSADRSETYRWITDTLKRFRYHYLKKKDKSVVKEYCKKMTGYSRAQITRIVAPPETKKKRAEDQEKERKKKELVGSSGKPYRFPVKYSAIDIALLIKTDEAHGRLSGLATKKILEREYEFGHTAYERIRNISPAHMYNLRGTRQYVSKLGTFTKTNPTPIPIGERRKPENEGQPGYIRVDTVHQGDYLDGNIHKKGVYYINLVDEVTQWEVTVAVEGISEQFLLPVLAAALDQFPFRLINFHSDNGSEFINKVVAKLLAKLLIHQTKSRPRHSNDNGLVESKNGAIIRKHMGYAHIPQRHAKKINHFLNTFMNPYLNFHRPSGFATMVEDKKKPGRMRPVYKTYLTPLEKLKTVENLTNYLKTPQTLMLMEHLAKQKSDNEAATEMQTAKRELFHAIRLREEQLRQALDPRFRRLSPPVTNNFANLSNQPNCQT
ncbi:MAG: hypothetical protein A3I29_02605 [Candidatus Magasanikbacteria bacterium RIFCSPLOWO2_02_FULL_44_11]|uniref:Integrase catalytic domain-containing protein n=1 Tax=Candidatus Magasanikbacteria bacterium RIFCSPLOWO2_02_FULL_44_11 TaxID=1798689 RepID=A0A1F6NBP4_9BACT|nr:MAG: hypothetical protein A3I29_02605 [Candidatus Magasanikbacteria bacterium RIFCSPLOWO2_02_FULL_44_11]